MPVSRCRLFRSALILCVGAALSACASPTSVALRGDGVFAVPGDGAVHPRLRYVDGQLSRNDTCMIRMGNALNPKIPPMYVNGEPLGFC